MSSPWREFELLVARIEAALAPLGASVKSPDRIPDRISGNLREVDAAIRLPLGDASTLITIECRDRQTVEDNPWIEQLVTKRHSIGASKTIAVSSRGFSEPALRKAAYYGIEARVLRDIETVNVLQLLNLRLREHVYRAELRGLRFGFAQTDAAAAVPSLSPSVLSLLRVNPSDAPIFHRDAGGPVSWNGMWKLLQQRDFANLYGSVRTDGTPTETRVHLNFSDRVYVETVNGMHQVLSVQADLALFCDDRENAMSPKRTSEYSDSSGALAQAVSYVADASFGEVKLLSVRALDTQQTHLTLSLSPTPNAGRNADEGA